LPTRAVQFTILSIIASGFKIADAFIYTALWPHKFFGAIAIIDKTLFYETCNLGQVQIISINLYVERVSPKATQLSNFKANLI